MWPCHLNSAVCVGAAGGGLNDPGFTAAQLQAVTQAETLGEERDEEITKVSVCC